MHMDLPFKKLHRLREKMTGCGNRIDQRLMHIQDRLSDKYSTEPPVSLFMPLEFCFVEQL